MKAMNMARIPEYIKRGFDKYKYVLLVCAVGLVVAVFPFGRESEKAEEPPAPAVQLEDPASFQYTLEQALGCIEGVGRVKVVLTIKSGYESVYVQDETTSDSSSENGATRRTDKSTELVIISGASGDTPVVTKINYPVFLGAVVICDGADKAAIRLELTEVIRSLTGISSDNIVITKMKK